MFGYLSMVRLFSEHEYHSTRECFVPVNCAHKDWHEPTLNRRYALSRGTRSLHLTNVIPCRLPAFYLFCLVFWIELCYDCCFFPFQITGLHQVGWFYDTRLQSSRLCVVFWYFLSFARVKSLVAEVNYTRHGIAMFQFNCQKNTFETSTYSVGVIRCSCVNQ